MPVPEGWVLVPEKLTAENGAKAALIGEFFIEVEHEDNEEGRSWMEKYPIDWTTIKDIHKRVVALYKEKNHGQ